MKRRPCEWPRTPQKNKKTQDPEGVAYDMRWLHHSEPVLGANATLVGGCTGTGDGRAVSARAAAQSTYNFPPSPPNRNSLSLSILPRTRRDTHFHTCKLVDKGLNQAQKLIIVPWARHIEVKVAYGTVR